MMCESLKEGDKIITILVNMHGSVIKLFDEENPPPSIFTKTRILSYAGDFRDITNSSQPNMIYGQTKIDMRGRWKDKTTMDMIEKHREHAMHHTEDSLCEVHNHPMYDKIWGNSNSNIFFRCLEYLFGEVLGVFLISIHVYENGELKFLPIPDEPMDLLKKENMEKMGELLGQSIEDIEKGLKEMPAESNECEMSKLLGYIDNMTKGNIRINLFDYSCSSLSQELMSQKEQIEPQIKQIRTWNKQSHKLRQKRGHKWGGHKGRRKTKKRLYSKTRRVHKQK